MFRLRLYYIMLNLAYWMIHFKVMPMQATKLARYAYYSACSIWTAQEQEQEQHVFTDPNDLATYIDKQINVLSTPNTRIVCVTCAYSDVCIQQGINYICPHMLVFGGRS